jgi:cytochrome c2
LDEFQNFIEKETFDAITSDTKKFQIGFVGASKSLQDLPEDFRNQLIINVGCMACFSLAKKDGDMLGPQMFRVDGRKKKHETLQNFINPFNTSHNFELISDEEKLNIDRVVGQAERTYFLYRVGTVAGVFHLNTHTFNDVQEKHVNQKIVRKMHGLKSENNGKAAIGAS